MRVTLIVGTQTVGTQTVGTQTGGTQTAGAELAEDTVIEFGTPQEVLFGSGLPLDFTGRVHLQNVDGSLDTEAVIVALQLHRGKTAVAARFVGNVKNWIVKR